MKSRERIICLILFVFLSSIYKITPSKTEEVVQTLHNKISNDLLSIRKEYPKSQPMVYSLLDQVCKMYQISKSAMEGKKKLKNLVQTKELENKLLKGENATLKNEVDSLKTDLSSTQQNLTSIAKKLDQKNMLLSFAAKEKLKLTIEKERLEEERKLLSKQEKENHSEKNEILSNNEMAENNVQSLSLTSTSAPNSPL